MPQGSYRRLIHWFWDTKSIMPPSFILVTMFEHPTPSYSNVLFFSLLFYFFSTVRGILFLATESKHLISSRVAVEGSVFFNQISTAHSVLWDFLMTAQAVVSLSEPKPTCCWLHTDTHSHSVDSPLPARLQLCTKHVLNTSLPY